MPQEYFLDNNALKDYARGEPNTMRRVEENLPHVYVSSVVAEELLTGVIDGMNRARKPRSGLSLTRAHRSFVQALEDINLLPVLTYSDEAEAVFKTFPASVIRVGRQDCRIAAQALAHNLIVVTRNVRDFEAIGAPCEDWSR